jgi:hypothetical protein
MGFFDIFKNLTVSSAPNVVSLNTARRIKDDWDNVEILIKGSSPAQLKQALITADKILDSALKEISIGDGMAERMKNIRPRLDPGSYNRMWEAHKLRNNIVHEINFDPPHFVLKEAVANLKNVLYKLGVSL